MISYATAQEINNLIKLNGEKRTRTKLKLSEETFNRYKRLIRQYSKPLIAKILIIDIETLYMVGGIWRPWKQNIQSNQIFKPTSLLSWSAKWLFDNEIMGDILTPKEAKKRKDKRIIQSLWKLFDEADIIIAHNGQAFDLPRMNSFFIKAGLNPPSPYRVVDTNRVARKHFGFDYNKLSFLAQELNVPHNKLKTDFELWIDCDKGDKDALKKMLGYNKMDVLVLEEIYLKMRGWIKGHPNLNLYTDEHVCSNCGSKNIKLKGSYKTPLNSYKTMVCGDCGAYSRKGKKKLTSIAS